MTLAEARRWKLLAYFEMQKNNNSETILNLLVSLAQ